MTDCLIVGFNDYDFARYVDMVAAMGRHSGAYRDLALAFVDVDGRPARALDVLTAYRPDEPPFANTDFLWPTITCLGSYLARRGFTVDYVNQFQPERERLREKLARGDVLSVAVTTTLYVIPEPILEIVAFVRACAPRVTVIVGGPYLRNQTTGADPDAARRTFRYLGADVYVDSGEGERALGQVLAALKDGRGLDGIDNVAFRRGDDYAVNASAVESNDLAENPVDYARFPDLGQFVSLRTAKSCPFACAFCGFPQRAGRYTYLPVDLVERELDALHARGGVTTVTFLDDTFNVPKRRFKDLLRMMIGKRYPFRWNCFYRSDHGDAETIDLMGEAGCEGVFLGVESGSAAMLERMNKTARPEDYLAAIPRFAQAGISTYASLIVGYPGETFATARETMAFLHAARPDFFRAQLWYADHQTPVWAELERWRIEGEGFNWRHATMDSATASDLVEEMFLGVEGSLWMPQYGFEQWSTFYLQRRGMSMAQVKRFVRRFNEVIKARLIRPGRRDADPVLMERLRASCRFDAPGPAGADDAERYPAVAYTAAQRFWIEAFRAPCRLSLAAQLGDGASAGPPAWNEIAVDAEPAALDEVAAACGVDGPDLLVPLLAGLLSRLGGEEDVVLVERTGAGLVPRRLRPRWDAGFRICAAAAADRAAQARSHEAYAWTLLTNPVRMREAGAACPTFEAGVERGEAPETPWPGSVRLVLRGAGPTPGPALALRYDRSVYGEATIREVAACLGAFVRAVASDVDAPLGGLALGAAPVAAAAETGRDAERFTFEE